MKNIKISLLLLVMWSTTAAQNIHQTANGNVGIGITVPEYLLDIKSSTSNEDMLRLSHPFSPAGAGFTIGFGKNKDLFDNGAINFKVEYSSIDYSVIGINRANRDFYYLGDGNVGIGTNSPTNALHLSNLDEDGINLNSEFRLRTSSSNDFLLEHIGDDGNLLIRSMEAGDSSGDLVINDLGGNVGVGRNPVSFMDLFGGQTGDVVLRLEADSDNDGGEADNPRIEMFQDAQLIGASIGFNEDTPTPRNIFQFGMTSPSGFVPYALTIDPYNGFVGIGTVDAQARLSVDGDVRATEVTILADVTVPDYVFEPDYELRTLKETKEYIRKNKHLPEIPSALEIGETGIQLGDMNMRLLKKIEELTLHQIQLFEKLEKQNAQLLEQQIRIDKLENEN